ncbi:MAG: HEAT repeat domain-containing protein [bacterium]|nr:HEAT repeat domain-containing protein [bacterium]
MLATVFVPRSAAIAQESAVLTQQELQLQRIQADLDRGGESRRRAIWYIYQNKQHQLLPAAAAYLFQSEDIEDHKAVLRVFHAYGDELERYLPNWHVILDRYMTPEANDQVVLECIKLTMRWEEGRLIHALNRLAKHPQSSVRLAAFGGTAKLSNDMLIPVLVRLMQSERAVFRIYGLEGIRYFGDKRLWTFLSDALADPSKSVRIYAVQALAEQPNGAERSHHLARRYTGERDPEVRGRIIEVIAERRWLRHLSVIHRGVSDGVPLVRKFALDAVESLNDRRAARFISRQLAQEDRRELKLQAMRLLMLLENSGGGSGLRTLLEGDEDPSVRQKAALALGYLKDRSGVFSLARAVQEDEAEAVRMESAGALGNLGDNRANSALIETIRRTDESYEVRSAATLALARIGSKESLRALESLSQEYQGQALGAEIQQLLVRLRK